MDLSKLLGALNDVSALVALLGQRAGFLALVQLQVADGQALAELLDLVAGVVDIELAGDIAAGPIQAGGQTVTQGTAAGVTHVHGAGGVGGNELHVILFAGTGVGAAVFRVGAGGADSAGEPILTQEQVDEAGACNVHAGEQRAVQVQLGGDSLSDLAGCLMESTRTGHGNVGCYVTVFDVRRDLDDEIGQFRGGQVAIGHGGLGGIGQQGAGFGQRGLAL